MFSQSVLAVQAVAPFLPVPALAFALLVMSGQASPFASGKGPTGQASK